MDMPEVEDLLLGIIDAYAERLPAGQAKDMADLVRAGEPGIGFENFCTQLYEYDISVDDGTLRQLTAIGSYMGLASSYWELLQDLKR